ncbi:hypothetical protein EPI10_007000 [Gossypium australe]|uniref:Uncharacterized protein n=1 Tax=Gossypium australe TaxID=47621 RepID=A0A5B6WSQ9_9ROSI|nr:hypothetical protein EPI10_007000 [Gossypium australe]
MGKHRKRCRFGPTHGLTRPIPGSACFLSAWERRRFGDENNFPISPPTFARCDSEQLQELKEIWGQ